MKTKICILFLCLFAFLGSSEVIAITDDDCDKQEIEGYSTGENVDLESPVTFSKSTLSSTVYSYLESQLIPISIQSIQHDEVMSLGVYFCPQVTHIFLAYNPNPFSQSIIRETSPPA